MTDIRGQKFDMGRVARLTFGALGRNLATFLILAIVLIGIPRLVVGLLFASMLTAAGQATAAALASGGARATFIISGIVNLVFSGMLQAAIVHGAVSDLNGRRSSLAELFTTGARFAVPAIAISVMFGVVAFLGTIFFIVPGLMVITTWIVALPAEVVEKTGVMSAFGRSGDLTKGHRWSILGLVIVYLLAASLIGLVIAGLSGGFVNFARAGAAGVASLPVLIIRALVTALSSLIGAVGVAAIYYELRSIRDGVAPANLAAVFD